MALNRNLFFCSTILAASPLYAVQQPTSSEAAPRAQGQEVGPADVDNSGELEDEAPIVITGGRMRGSVVGDIPPQNVLDARDVRATGATSINELLDALAPQIGSSQGRGGERPVLLLDGKRISGFRELRDIPTEAIERVEILPEEVALKYGYAASQKVVNVVLRQRFRSTTVEGRANASTEGGYVSATGDLTRLMINRGGRTMFNVHAEQNSKLTEDERDILGEENQQAARTLIGAKSLIRASATANRTILGDVSATANVEAEHGGGRALLGIGPTTFVILDRIIKDDSLHAGFALNGDKGKWNWSVTGNGDVAWSRTESDRDNAVYPQDDSRERIASGDVSAVANGNLLKLPAGDVGATLRVGAEAINIDARRERLGAVSANSLSRTQGTAAINLDLPISRRKRDFSALGDLTINANGEVRQVSDFGTLATLGAGAHWSPAERLSFIASWSRQEGAPTVEQLSSPILETADSRIFDFVNGETVFANVITGGNPALQSDSRRLWKLGANWQPIKGTDLRLRTEWVNATTDRPIQQLFGPTPTLEAAFPERFVRDSTGQLVSADLRPVNFDHARKQTVRIGFDFSKPLKSAQPSQSVRDQMRAQFRSNREGGTNRGSPTPSDNENSPEGAPTRDGTRSGEAGGERRGGFRGGGGGFFGGGNRGRLTFSLTDTITLVDEVIIGAGLPKIDYLDGDAAGASGGTPRHRVEARAGWANNGFGARLSGNWRSGTRVDSLAAGTLRFSPLATFDLRLFANLGERPEWVLNHPWLRGSSVRLEVSNLFDAKPKVRDASGAVPLNYQRDLLDPLGRTVMISFRKLFLPSFATMRRDFDREPR